LTELVARPSRGRVYIGERSVRLGDVSPKGRLRLDAVARYLQDVANDDGADAIGEDAMAWVLRRLTVEVDRFPVLRERLTLATWCSGVGSRWAERRTAIEGERGGQIETAAIWVHIDMATGRPRKLTPGFDAHYRESAGGRTVAARLHHDEPPPDPDERRAWAPRFADFDVLGHVNNAVYAAMVEEMVDLHAPCAVEIEFRGGISRGDAVELVRAGDAMWITAAGAVAASAVLHLGST
jgi:acyl-ACP thioesterase